EQVGYDDPTDIATDMSFFEDLSMDEAGFLEMISIIEEEFSIEIDEEIIEEMDSIDDIISYIKKIIDQESFD
ncbi:MAG: phosphopantetheine-binding protein, partial [Acidaminobacteraceae bacterium]